MLAYILKRILLMLPTLLGVLLLTFVVIQFVPGGPVEQLMAEARSSDKGGAGGEGGGEGEGGGDFGGELALGAVARAEGGRAGDIHGEHGGELTIGLPA